MMMGFRRLAFKIQHRSHNTMLSTCVVLGLSTAALPSSIQTATDPSVALRQVASSREGIQTKTAGISSRNAITDVITAHDGANLIVSILTDGPVKHKAFVLSDPRRLVLDFVDADNRVPFLNRTLNDLNVRQIRIRQFQAADPRIVRMVFDLKEGYEQHQIGSDDHSVRLVFQSNNQGEPSPTKDVSNAASQVEGLRDSKPESDSRLTAPATDSDQPQLQTITTTPTNQPIDRDPSPGIERAAVFVEEPVTEQKESTVTPVTATQPVTPSAALSRSISPSPRPFPQETRFGGEPLTLDLVEIPLVDFFRLMAEEGGINVVMDPEIRGTISIKVVKVPWDQILEAALVNHGLDKKIEGNLVRIASKKTLQEEAKQQESLKKATLLAADVETRIVRLNYAKAADLVVSVSDQKTVRGTVVVDERTNSLIVTDLPSSVERLVELIGSLDVPQPQVEIEARIVSATRDFARDIGIQFGFVQGNLERVTVGGPNTFGTIGGTRPAATPVSTFAAGNSSSGRGAADSRSSQSAGVSTGVTDNNAGNFNVNLPAQRAFGGLGLSVGNIFDTFLLDAAITAGETKGLAKLISQPKVTAQNNSAAVIRQGLRFPVQIIANNTVTVQFQDAALTLTVTPQITYEGNIILDLKVENNTPDFARQVNGIPSIRTSESTTRVLVSDGGTMVIGGILIDNETTQEDRVPGLASLPMVGNLFRRSSVTHSTQEVLFFITPRVVK